MNTAIHYHHAGMGQTTNPPPTTAQLAGGAAAGYSTAAAQIIHGDYVGGAGATLLTTALLVPYPANLFLAVAGGVAELLGAIGIGKGCGQTCITATEFANQAEGYLRQNLNTYMALPTPRAQSAQTAALNVFDQVWQALISVQACGNPALGDPGKRCISDRQAGSCAYHDANGNCWNWFVGYRDPIANDTSVVADTAASAASGVLSTVSSATGIDPTILMIGAGVAIVLMMVSSS